MSLRVIPRRVFRVQLEQSPLGPCVDENCPTILAGPDHPDLCAGCIQAFALVGIRGNEQLTLDDEAAA
jgi:hypothetical protein